MPEEKKVIFVTGQRGTGKSYLALHLARGFNRYIIFDTLGEYTDGVVIQNIDTFKNYFSKVYTQDFRIVYQPLKPEDEFNEICPIIYECGDLCFLVDELDLFCRALSIGDGFASILQRGRHKNITLIGVSQRPFGIHRLITSQAKAIYSFRHMEPRDIEYLVSYIGPEAEKIKDLGQYEFLHYENQVCRITKL